MASPDTVDFTEIPLEEFTKKPKKLPKRRLYFSDGCLDEYSTDEELDSESTSETQKLIDPTTLTWMPYLWYMSWWFGSRAVAVCDYLGEHLAYFFGITSPKFQYEMEQYKQMLEEEEAAKKKLEADNAGWNENKPPLIISNPIEMAPVSSQVKIDSLAKTSVAKESNLIALDPGSQTWERY